VPYILIITAHFEIHFLLLPIHCSYCLNREIWFIVYVSCANPTGCDRLVHLLIHLSEGGFGRYRTLARKFTWRSIRLLWFVFHFKLLFRLFNISYISVKDHFIFLLMSYEYRLVIHNKMRAQCMHIDHYGNICICEESPFFPASIILLWTIWTLTIWSNLFSVFYAKLLEFCIGVKNIFRYSEWCFRSIYKLFYISQLSVVERLSCSAAQLGLE